MCKRKFTIQAVLLLLCNVGSLCIENAEIKDERETPYFLKEGLNKLTFLFGDKITSLERSREQQSNQLTKITSELRNMELNTSLTNERIQTIQTDLVEIKSLVMNLLSAAEAETSETTNANEHSTIPPEIESCETRVNFSEARFVKVPVAKLSNFSNILVAGKEPTGADLYFCKFEFNNHWMFGKGGGSYCFVASYTKEGWENDEKKIYVMEKPSECDSISWESNWPTANGLPVLSKYNRNNDTCRVAIRVKNVIGNFGTTRGDIFIGRVDKFNSIMPGPVMKDIGLSVSFADKKYEFSTYDTLTCEATL